MSTSPLQGVLNICTPEECRWISDAVRPDSDWRDTDDRDEQHRRFYQKQWDLIGAIQDPSNDSVPDWLRQRFHGTQADLPPGDGEDT